MGVAGKHELDVGFRKHFTSPMTGVVAEQDLEHACCACHRFRQSGMVGERWTAAVFYPYQGDAVVLLMELDMAVVQKCPSHPGLFGFEAVQLCLLLLGSVPFDIGGIVVVAQYGIHAVFGFQLGEDRDKGIQFAGEVVHQIAREDDEVWLQAIDDVYSL